jgi:hypothetical protein
MLRGRKDERRTMPGKALPASSDTDFVHLKKTFEEDML